MKTHIISLSYLRMAIQRTKWLSSTKAMAVSSEHAPIKGRGEDLLHGACVIFPLQ